MEYLESPPRARLVDPTLHAGLAGFTCGGDSPYEVEVDSIVALMHEGQMPHARCMVAEDVSAGALVGLCAVLPRELALAPPEPPIPDAAYVQVIAVHAAFRGFRLPDDSRIGDFLLSHGLRLVEAAWGGPPMPPVWALIDRPNVPSHRLFERYGFELIPGEPPGYDIRYRARAVPLPRP